MLAAATPVCPSCQTRTRVSPSTAKSRSTAATGPCCARTVRAGTLTCRVHNADRIAGEDPPARALPSAPRLRSARTPAAMIRWRAQARQCGRKLAPVRAAGQLEKRAHVPGAGRGGVPAVPFAAALARTDVRSGAPRSPASSCSWRSVGAIDVWLGAAEVCTGCTHALRTAAH